MKFTDLIKNKKPSYYVVYFLILLHFIGGMITNLSILITSIWVFYYIVFVRRWDIYLIFLLILPTICFSVENDLGIGESLSIFDNFNNVWLLGPLALSSNFTMALAIPIRLLIDFGKTKFKFLTIIIFINIFLAICGLLFSLLSGESNPSGLTVGFRITLSLGTVLLSKSIIDKKTFIEGLDKIILVSFILLILDVLNNHWFFVVFGFVPYFVYRIKPKFLALLPLFISFNILYNLSNTITIIATLLISFIFYLFINIGDKMRNFITSRHIISLIIIIPIIITIFTLSLNQTGDYDLTTFDGFVKFKLLGDRKPIWDATWDNIRTSSFFVKPAGSSLDVYFDFTQKWVDWTAGSHNIFLEIGRQVGLFSMISLTTILLIMLNKAGRYLNSKNDMILFFCFLSVFLIFGLTGQSLIYDGVGSLFWLLVGQFYHVSSENMDSDSYKPNSLQKEIVTEKNSPEIL
ncbi:MAG: hypothetical protein HXX14_13160 [Bacteroidetes bacterium]|nr:hypothetical protein [Bacteroidota bacterium]